MNPRSATRLRPLLLVLGAPLALVLPARAQQGAWTQPEGEAFVQLSVTNIGPYDELFRRHGDDFTTGREITETSVELYGEYGFAEGWTVLGTLPVRSIDTGSTNSDATIQPVTIGDDTLTRAGNVFLAVRRQLFDEGFAVAGQLGVELPTGSSDDSSGLATGLDATTFLPTIAFGQGFGEAYVQAYLGLGFKTNDYSNDWRAGVESGYRFVEELLVAATLDVVDSFEDGDVDLDPSFRETGLYVDEQEYVSLGVKGLWDVGEHFGLSAAVRGAFSGNEVPKAPYVSVGVTFRP